MLPLQQAQPGWSFYDTAWDVSKAQGAGYGGDDGVSDGAMLMIVATSIVTTTTPTHPHPPRSCPRFGSHQRRPLGGERVAVRARAHARALAEACTLFCKWHAAHAALEWALLFRLCVTVFCESSCYCCQQIAPPFCDTLLLLSCLHITYAFRC